MILKCESDFNDHAFRSLFSGASKNVGFDLTADPTVVYSNGKSMLIKAMSPVVNN